MWKYVLLLVSLLTVGCYSASTSPQPVEYERCLYHRNTWHNLSYERMWAIEPYCRFDDDYYVITYQSTLYNRPFKIHRHPYIRQERHRDEPRRNNPYERPRRRKP